MLDAGADVKAVLHEVRDPTVLGRAISRHHSHNRSLVLLRCSLKAGADPNARTRRWSHLCTAVRSNPMARHELLAARADVSVALEEVDGSALATAAFHGNVDGCKLLLDAAVDVNMPLRGYFPNVLYAPMTGNMRYERLYPTRRYHRSDYITCGPRSVLILSGDSLRKALKARC